MSKCTDLEPLFTPYVDGDAAAVDRASVDAHLAKCPPCRDRVAAQRTARAVIHARRPALRACAPEQLRARCAAHAGAARLGTRSSRAPFARKWVPLSVAATLVMAVAGAFLFSANNKVEALTAQLTLDHMTCFQFAPERLQHSDARAAEHAWMETQGWGIRVPPSSSANQLELLGVRRCAMSSGRVAHILYRWRDRPLSVFVVPRMLRKAPQQDVIDRFGHEAVIWSGRTRTYVILARGRPTDFEPLVGYLKAHAE